MYQILSIPEEGPSFSGYIDVFNEIEKVFLKENELLC